MSAQLATASPRRIKASHRRRRRIASGQSVQRYYDPTIGRFLSVDPVTAYSNPIGAFNRYWYANNNPYRFTDPDGRCPEGSSNRTCIESTVEPTQTKTIMVSDEQAAAAKSDHSAVDVGRGINEKMGSINRQSDGTLKVEASADATTSRYKGIADMPSNAEVVIHGHPPESGLRDDQKSIGDADPLVSIGKPNIAVAADGRMAAHELENGRYQIRAISGQFTPKEIKQFLKEVNSRQPIFNESGQ